MMNKMTVVDNGVYNDLVVDGLPVGNTCSAHYDGEGGADPLKGAVMAKRIALCYNALVELTDRQIEEGAFTKLRADRDALLVDRDNWREDARALRESQERLCKQRDELLEALKVAQGFVSEVSKKTGFGQDYTLKVIRTAISNVKGGMI